MSRYFYRRDGGCGCQDQPDGGGQTPALAFVPSQVFGEVYEPEAGFPRGTLFPDLDKPFLAAGGKNCGL